MDVPTPTALGAYVADVVHAAEQVKDLYRWAHPNAWEPPNHGRSGSRSASQRCERCREGGVCERCYSRPSPDGICPGNGCRDARLIPCPDCGGAGVLPVSEDRVASQVLSTERYRVLVRHAAREVADARNRLRGAVADLNDALALLEPPAGPQVADVRLLPHPADAGDLRRAQAAQKRRAERAERSGDWSEVTGE